MYKLTGKRILVVEDEFLIGAMVADMLSNAEAVVIGPATNKDEGMALASVEDFDAAVLDVNLRGECSDVIAAELQKRRIPFVFATGYGDQPQRSGTHAPVICKPFREEDLVEALAEVLDNRAQ